MNSDYYVYIEREKGDRVEVPEIDYLWVRIEGVSLYSKEISFH